MKKNYLLLLMVCFVAILVFLEQQHKAHMKPSGIKVKVGIIGPISGENMTKGLMGLQGIKIAQQLIPYLNNGDEIEWVAKDDQDIPEKSVNALKSLAETDKVVAIIMFSGSDSVLAVTKIANQYKIPILTLFASHPDITKHSSFVNQFNFDDTFQANVAALYIRDELLIDKVAVITQADNMHLSYLASEFAQQFSAARGTITDTFEIQTTTQTDYTKILLAIKSKDPELLYLPVSLEHIFQIKLALIRLDWFPGIMASDGILASAKAQKNYPINLIEDILAIDAFSYDMQFTPFGERLLKKITSMGINTQDIGTYNALAMEGYALLIQVMNECDVLHKLPVCINNSIRSTFQFEGIKGLISFDKNGRSHRSLVVNTIHDGVTEFVVQVY